jgi:hypothetical protein
LIYIKLTLYSNKNITFHETGTKTICNYSYFTVVIGSCKYYEGDIALRINKWIENVAKENVVIKIVVFKNETWNQ